MFLFGKKSKGLILVFLSLVFLLFCCRSNKVYESKVINNNEKEINIVTTIFPIYDITKTLTRNVKNINTSMLIDSGIDLHNYSPTSNDLIKLSKSDLFIYIGGESDVWVDDAFASLNIDGNKKINLMEELKFEIKEEEQKEGMEEDDAEDGEIEYDEHIWLSLRNAKKISKIIFDRLNGIVSMGDRETLNTNYNFYINKLDELDNNFTLLVNNAREKNKSTILLFADRFPFRYFVDDYGLDYYAAFKGCSAETEASFKTIKFLTDKINEYNLKNIFIIEGNDKKIAETVINASMKDDIEILVLDSMQNKTMKDVENGLTYFDIMEKNYEVLNTHFN